MFGLGVQELLLIGGIGVLLFGGPKIAQLGRGLGEGLVNFKRGLKEAKDVGRELEGDLREVDRDVRDATR